jgi:hypothetical protein
VTALVYFLVAANASAVLLRADDESVPSRLSTRESGQALFEHIARGAAHGGAPRR